MTDKTCDYDGVPHSKRGRFCSDKCRALWHRTHDPRGQVSSVRRLKSGKVAVLVRFEGAEAERAVHLMVGSPAVVGECAEGGAA